MRPPAQVVTLVFVCTAALIDLSMIQTNRDPPLALTFACERRIGALIDGCRGGAAPSLHDGAHQGLDGSAERLSKLLGCTSVCPEVPA